MPGVSFSSFFDDPSDVIKSNTLTSTRVVAVLTAIATGVAAVLDNGPFKDLKPDGLKLVVWFGLATLIVVLVVADMFARAYVTGKAVVTPIMRVEPRPMKIRSVDSSSPPPEGHALAARIGAAGRMEILFQADTDKSVKWVAFDDVEVKI